MDGSSLKEDSIDDVPSSTSEDALAEEPSDDEGADELVDDEDQHDEDAAKQTTTLGNGSAGRDGVHSTGALIAFVVAMCLLL